MRIFVTRTGRDRGDGSSPCLRGRGVVRGLAAAAATALFLAGCGGGGGDQPASTPTPTPTPTSTPTPTPTSTPTPTPTMGPSAADILIMRYREEAKGAKDMARMYAEQARANATKARAEATAARAAATMARNALRDYKTAEMKATEAETAAAAAEAAATAAENAARTAMDEYEKAKAPEVTADAAKTARDEARRQSRLAMERNTGAMGANAHYMTAKTRRMEADQASMIYVLELLKYASGQDEATGAARKTRRMTVARWIAEAATTGTGENGPFRYAFNQFDITGSDSTDDARTQVDILSRYRSGPPGALSADTGNPEVAPPATPNFRSTTSAGAVVVHDIGKERVYHLGHGSTTYMMTGGTDANGVVDVTQTDLPMLGGFTGVELFKSATADTGYAHIYTDYDESKRRRISGSAGATVEMPDPDYIAFGLWLRNIGNPVTRVDLGAFASGNMPFSWSSPSALDAVTGMAEYMGSAAGLHAKSGAVDAVAPFAAKARLTADFGSDSTGGEIRGRIYDIVSGGTPISGAVNLAPTPIDDTGGSGNGVADMGPLNGRWDHHFMGPAGDMPGSVTGTFVVTGQTAGSGTPATTDDLTESFIGAFGAHKP